MCINVDVYEGTFYYYTHVVHTHDIYYVIWCERARITASENEKYCTHVSQLLNYCTVVVFRSTCTCMKN